MRANELRIGNWYQSVKFNVPVRCDLSDMYELCARSDGAYNDPPIDEMFEPIPLTEEWLLKFGFIEKKYPKSRAWASMFIIRKSEFWEPFIIDKKYGGLKANRWIRFSSLNIISKQVDGLKYVHQLQDLYFALTGQELEIKE